MIQAKTGLCSWHFFKEVDNDPDVNAAVDIEDHTMGSEVDLDEKPQNMIELQVGGDGSPFLLRLIHFKQNSIPDNIQVRPGKCKVHISFKQFPFRLANHTPQALLLPMLATLAPLLSLIFMQSLASPMKTTGSHF